MVDCKSFCMAFPNKKTFMLLLVYIMVAKFFCSLIYVTLMVYFESVHFHGKWGCLVDKVLGFLMPRE
jgi:hypothetical protein